MCLFGKKGVSAEVQKDVGDAIKHIAELKGYQRYMGKNDLASFYTSSADATAAQDVMYGVMGPVVAEIIKNQ